MFNLLKRALGDTKRITCSVCLIAKNEGPYLIEWIAYYKTLGFDEIIVYENNSTDDSARILAKLEEKGQIVYRPWPYGKSESPQITAYADAVRQATTDWILFVDCDEFLVFKSTTLTAMLELIHPLSDISAIGVNWRIFGSSNLKAVDHRLVIERFTMASHSDFIMNDHIKSFLRVGAIGPHIDMHLSDVTGRVVFADGADLESISRGRSTSIRHDIAQINHYYTKTLEEFQIKKNRGQGGAGENNATVKYWYSEGTFHAHDKNDEVDLCAQSHIDEVKKTIKKLKAIVGDR